MILRFLLTFPLLIQNVLSATQAKIQSINVNCEEDGMGVDIQFDQAFHGVIFSKNFFSTPGCNYINNPGRDKVHFTIKAGQCGTVIQQAASNAVTGKRQRREANSTLLDTTTTHAPKNGSELRQGRSDMFGFDFGKIDRMLSFGMPGSNGGSMYENSREDMPPPEAMEFMQQQPQQQNSPVQQQVQAVQANGPDQSAQYAGSQVASMNTLPQPQFQGQLPVSNFQAPNPSINIPVAPQAGHMSAAEGDRIQQYLNSQANRAQTPLTAFGNVNGLYPSAGYNPNTHTKVMNFNSAPQPPVPPNPMGSYNLPQGLSVQLPPGAQNSNGDYYNQYQQTNQIQNNYQPSQYAQIPLSQQYANNAGTPAGAYETSDADAPYGDDTNTTRASVEDAYAFPEYSSTAASDAEQQYMRSDNYNTPGQVSNVQGFAGYSSAPYGSAVPNAQYLGPSGRQYDGDQYNPPTVPPMPNYPNAPQGMNPPMMPQVPNYPGGQQMPGYPSVPGAMEMPPAPDMPAYSGGSMLSPPSMPQIPIPDQSYGSGMPQMPQQPQMPQIPQPQFPDSYGGGMPQQPYGGGMPQQPPMPQMPQPQVPDYGGGNQGYMGGMPTAPSVPEPPPMQGYDGGMQGNYGNNAYSGGSYATPPSNSYNGGQTINSEVTARRTPSTTPTTQPRRRTSSKAIDEGVTARKTTTTTRATTTEEEDTGYITTRAATTRTTAARLRTTTAADDDAEDTTEATKATTRTTTRATTTRTTTTTEADEEDTDAVVTKSTIRTTRPATTAARLRTTTEPEEEEYLARKKPTASETADTGVRKAAKNSLPVLRAVLKEVQGGSRFGTSESETESANSASESGSSSSNKAAVSSSGTQVAGTGGKKEETDSGTAAKKESSGYGSGAYSGGTPANTGYGSSGNSGTANRGSGDGYDTRYDQMGQEPAFGYHEPNNQYDARYESNGVDQSAGGREPTFGYKEPSGPSEPRFQYNEPSDQYREPGFGYREPVGQFNQEPAFGYREPSGPSEPRFQYNEPAGQFNREPAFGYHEPGDRYNQDASAGGSEPAFGYREPNFGYNEPKFGYQEPQGGLMPESGAFNQDMSGGPNGRGYPNGNGQAGAQQGAGVNRGVAQQGGQVVNGPNAVVANAQANGQFSGGNVATNAGGGQGKIVGNANAASIPGKSNSGGNNAAKSTSNAAGNGQIQGAVSTGSNGNAASIPGKSGNGVKAGGSATAGSASGSGSGNGGTSSMSTKNTGNANNGAMASGGALQSGAADTSRKSKGSNQNNNKAASKTSQTSDDNNSDIDEGSDDDTTTVRTTKKANAPSGQTQTGGQTGGRVASSLPSTGSNQGSRDGQGKKSDQAAGGSSTDSAAGGAAKGQSGATSGQRDQQKRKFDDGDEGNNNLPAPVISEVQKPKSSGTAQKADDNNDALDTSDGAYIENIIIIQNDPLVQEVWDAARAIRCEWRSNYKKTVFTKERIALTEVQTMRFAGDDIEVWMEIQAGKGPWADPVSNIVPIGHTMTLLIGANDPKHEFDLRIGRCLAHDGGKSQIDLTDDNGCVLRDRIMSKFDKAKDWGAEHATIAFAHFSAFKFPETTKVFIECDVEVCKRGCTEMCSTKAATGKSSESRRISIGSGGSSASGATNSQSAVSSSAISGAKQRQRRSVKTDKDTLSVRNHYEAVSPADLSFNIDINVPFQNGTIVYAGIKQNTDQFCMSRGGFGVGLGILLTAIIVTSILSVCLCVRYRNQKPLFM
ncbi:AT-rich interactive domain-containing protein 1A-like [Paramacrobiotus metropolitanus]|uniref:AT-rich interactive domain-containing protein 1A-like n=1 Tax=Paramacrobiotus metropolitanus TaxID=2943436 RepID=UPI002445E7F8|nr:AT-rich interactive domain-containing protein 1A-like [Paramacrobiotus metropolitanus]